MALNGEYRSKMLSLTVKDSSSYSQFQKSRENPYSTTYYSATTTTGAALVILFSTDVAAFTF